MLAAASSLLRSDLRSGLRGTPHRAAVLGVLPMAIYVEVDDAAVAIVTSDALRLPCAVVLPQRSCDLDLRSLVPDDVVTIGGQRLRWTSHGESVEVQVVREWTPARVAPTAVRDDRIAELRAPVSATDIGVPRTTAAELLLGRGPGLTPSGDDVLAGFLLAQRALGRPVAEPHDLHRTTTLSATLLRHAAAGWCVPQVAALVHALGASDPLGPSLHDVLAIGRTSGAALATGILYAVSDRGAVAA